MLQREIRLTAAQSGECRLGKAESVSLPKSTARTWFKTPETCQVLDWTDEQVKESDSTRNRLTTVQGSKITELKKARDGEQSEE